MSYNDKLEMTCRALCDANPFGAYPDTNIQLSDGRQGKGWQKQIPRAKELLARLDINESSYRSQPTGIRAIQL